MSDLERAAQVAEGFAKEWAAIGSYNGAPGIVMEWSKAATEIAAALRALCIAEPVATLVRERLKPPRFQLDDEMETPMHVETEVERVFDRTLNYGQMCKAIDSMKWHGDHDAPMVHVGDLKMALHQKCDETPQARELSDDDIWSIYNSVCKTQNKNEDPMELRFARAILSARSAQPTSK